MFGVSLPELLVVFAIVLIVFGPQKLPEVARTLGKFMGELKKSSDAVRREFYNSIYEPSREVRGRIDAGSRELKGIKNEIKDLIEGKEPHVSPTIDSDTNTKDKT